MSVFIYSLNMSLRTIWRCTSIYQSRSRCTLSNSPAGMSPFVFFTWKNVLLSKQHVGLQCGSVMFAKVIVTTKCLPYKFNHKNVLFFYWKWLERDCTLKDIVVAFLQYFSFSVLILSYKQTTTSKKYFLLCSTSASSHPPNHHSTHSKSTHEYGVAGPWWGRQASPLLRATSEEVPCGGSGVESGGHHHASLLLKPGTFVFGEKPCKIHSACKIHPVQAWGWLWMKQGEESLCFLSLLLLCNRNPMH